MKISLDWLREYLEGDISASQVIQALERIGLMVEGRDEKEGDVILEIETYSNRPDTLGHLGMAREVAAALGLSLKKRTWPLSELSTGTADLVDVQTWDEDLCPRYCGAVVKGVKVGPSPAWLRKRIESMGLNSINNVVDITNYVLFSTSQPIHAFDLDKVGGAKVIIRRAKKGEKLLCLNDTDLSLAPDMLVIADETKPIALAGVIGGQDSAVTEGTTNVFIESACFDPVSVRKTRKAVGLQTDASYRFERGADISFAPQAAVMAASLLTAFGGRICEDSVDIFPVPLKKRGIVLRHRRITDLLGVEVDQDFIQRTFRALGFDIESKQPGIWQVRIPTWRVDIEREADLIEEAARFYGYDKIPAVVPPLRVVDPIPDKLKGRARQIRPLLFHYGFNEVIDFSFTDAAREAMWATGLEPIEIRNPISVRTSLLRTTLLGGLVETAAWNRNRGLDAIQIFEIGKVYFREEQGFRERLTLGLLNSGMQDEPYWRTGSREADFFQLKGGCEALFHQLRYEPFSFEKAEHPFFEPGSCLALAFKEDKVGCLGRVAERIRDAYDLKQTVWAAEIDLDLLLGKQPRPFAYQPVAKYPSIIRDVSLLVPRDVAYQDIRQAIEKLPLPILEDVRLIDRYVGESVPPDKTSLSFRFVFRHLRRTLLAEEVERAEQQILNQLTRAFGVQLREGGQIDNRTGKN